MCNAVLVYVDSEDYGFLRMLHGHNVLPSHIIHRLGQPAFAQTIINFKEFGSYPAGFKYSALALCVINRFDST